MTVKLLLFVLFFLEFALTVIYRFDPPQGDQTPNQSLSNEKTNLIRRKFKNEAPIQSLPVEFCSTFDFTKKRCTECFDGFLLKDNQCLVNPDFDPKKKWNELSFIRVSSPSRVSNAPDYIVAHRDPFCLKATSDGALCLSCHPGFDLLDGKCVQKDQQLTAGEQIFLKPMEAPKHTFCQLFDQNGDCARCFPEFTYNGTDCVIIPKPELDCKLHQSCLPQSTQCLSYSSQGLCKTCPRQAINMNGICRINKLQSLCQQIDENGKCKRCSKFASLFDGVCKYKSPNCVQYNPDNTCNICLVTYRRVNGECIRPSKIMFVNSDPNCSTWKKGACVQCKYGFGFYKGYCIDLKQIQAAGLTPQADPIEVQLQN